MVQRQLLKKYLTTFLRTGFEQKIMTHHNNQLNTVQLTPKDFDCASILLAKAFYDNPSHVYIFPDQSSRLKALQWGLKTYLHLNLNYPSPVGESFALVEANKQPGIRQVKAMAFWHPPNSASISLLAKITTGWFTLPFRFGWRTWQRLLEVMEAMEYEKQKAIAQNQAWYLNNMVVAKELRGTGIGTKLLNEQLQSVVIPSGFPAILMTQKEENIRFYQRLGFEIASESIIGKGENSFTNWCLIFHPTNG